MSRDPWTSSPMISCMLLELIVRYQPASDFSSRNCLNSHSVVRTYWFRLSFLYFSVVMPRIRFLMALGEIKLAGWIPGRKRILHGFYADSTRILRGFRRNPTDSRRILRGFYADSTRIPVRIRRKTHGFRARRILRGFYADSTRIPRIPESAGFSIVSICY